MRIMVVMSSTRVKPLIRTKPERGLGGNFCLAIDVYRFILGLCRGALNSSYFDKYAVKHSSS